MGNVITAGLWGLSAAATCMYIPPLCALAVRSLVPSSGSAAQTRNDDVNLGAAWVAGLVLPSTLLGIGTSVTVLLALS